MTKYILSHRYGVTFDKREGYPVELDKQVLIPLSNIGAIEQEGQDIVAVTTSGTQILIGHAKSERVAKDGYMRLLRALKEGKQEILKLSFSENAGYLSDIPFD